MLSQRSWQHVHGALSAAGSSALLLALTLCLGRRWIIFRVWNAPIP
jgi:hypothetical protein